MKQCLCTIERPLSASSVDSTYLRRFLKRFFRAEWPMSRMRVPFWRETRISGGTLQVARWCMWCRAASLHKERAQVAFSRLTPLVYVMRSKSSSLDTRRSRLCCRQQSFYHELGFREQHRRLGTGSVFSAFSQSRNYLDPPPSL